MRPTYFTTSRGLESVATVWNLLDLTPFGRQEEWEDRPKGRPQSPPYQWWRPPRFDRLADTDRQDVPFGLELIQHGRQRDQGGPATMRVRLEGERQGPIVQADFHDPTAGASDPISDFDGATSQRRLDAQAVEGGWNDWIDA
jgi:hypothetical protein